MDIIPSKKDDTIFVTLGSNIRRARVSRRIYRKTMAKDLGVSVNELTCIERGEVDIDIISIFKMAKYFDLNPSTLLSCQQKVVFQLPSVESSSELFPHTAKAQQCMDELEALTYRLADCCDTIGNTFERFSLDADVKCGPLGPEQLKQYADEQHKAAAEMRKRLKNEGANGA